MSCGEHFFRSATAGLGRASDQWTRAPRPVRLSPREKQILTLIAEGESSKEIAAQLYIGLGTVETHRANLLSKLSARNVAGLVAYAFRSGLMQVSANRLRSQPRDND